MCAATLYPVSEDVTLIDLAPPIKGFDGFIGSYVLRSQKIALVDVGPSSSLPNLLEGLSTLGISPKEVSYVFITHLHIDHAGAIGGLLPYMPDAKVIVHEKGKSNLTDPQKLWDGSKQTLGDLAEQYGPIAPVPEDRIIVGHEGMTFDLGWGTTIEVLATPGHASHHLSFYDTGKKRLFVGEAAGVRVKGVLRPGTPPPFNLQVELASLDKLIRIEPSTLCYGHLGAAQDAVQNLRLHRQQLLLWLKIIARCVPESTKIDQIYLQLREKDELMRGLEQLPKDQYDRECFFIHNSIRGFLSYLEKYGVPGAVA